VVTGVLGGHNRKSASPKVPKLGSGQIQEKLPYGKEKEFHSAILKIKNHLSVDKKEKKTSGGFDGGEGVRASQRKSRKWRMTSSGKINSTLYEGGVIGNTDIWGNRHKSNLGGGGKAQVLNGGRKIITGVERIG